MRRKKSNRRTQRFLMQLLVLHCACFFRPVAADEWIREMMTAYVTRRPAKTPTKNRQYFRRKKSPGGADIDGECAIISTFT